MLMRCAQGQTYPGAACSGLSVQGTRRMGRLKRMSGMSTACEEIRYHRRRVCRFGAGLQW
jgi:hypothetical protein